MPAREETRNRLWKKVSQNPSQTPHRSRIHIRDRAKHSDHYNREPPEIAKQPRARSPIINQSRARLARIIFRRRPAEFKFPRNGPCTAARSRRRSNRHVRRINSELIPFETTRRIARLKSRERASFLHQAARFGIFRMLRAQIHARPIKLWLILKNNLRVLRAVIYIFHVRLAR